jgi:hypothetical protein
VTAQHSQEWIEEDDIMSNLTLAGLGEHVGKELGLSDWVAIDQQRCCSASSRAMPPPG